MRTIETSLGTLVIIMALFFTLGWALRGSYNDKAMKQEARQEFVRAITYGVATGMISVDTNKLPQTPKKVEIDF